MAVGVIISGIHLLVTRDNLPTFERLVVALCIVINGGFSAKFNGSSSIELLCKTEHLCFDFRHFAKPQNVRL
jgi:hypothetical protein